MSQLSGSMTSVKNASGANQHGLWAMLAASLVLALVLVQAAVSISPDIYWDVDPRAQQVAIPNTMFGPAHMAWINLISVAAAGLGLAVHGLGGGRLNLRVIGLAAAGSLAAAWHMPGHTLSMQHGGNWIAAVALAVAAWHLAQRSRVKRLFVAGLVAMAIPLALRSAFYVWVEHRQTVQMFLAQEEEFLRSRGWQRDSPQHLLYLRRLQSVDATGWFGLSNVFGSLMAAVTIAAAGWARASWRSWRSRHAILLAMVAALGVLSIYLTNSKGAALALLLGMLLLVGAEAAARIGWLRLFQRGALLLPAAAIAAVLVRGWLGPPDTWEGERSLLFRWHYWESTARMLIDVPSRLIAGVGPGWFQDLYTCYKHPLSPEEIVSTHNVFIDLISMLGVGGLCWTALLAWWLWRAGYIAGSGQTSEQATVVVDGAEDASGEIHVRELAWPGLVTLLVFGTQIAWHWPMMLPETLLLWLMGNAGFLIAMVLLLRSERFDRRWFNAGLFAAAAAMLTHSQIEMTFYAMGAASMAWFVLAVAGTGAVDHQPYGPTSRTQLRWTAGATAVAVGAMFWGHTLPVQREQQALAQAQRELLAGNPAAAASWLGRANAQVPSPRTVRWQATLLSEGAIYFEGRGQRDRAGELWDRALAVLAEAEQTGGTDLGLLRLRAQLLQRIAASDVSRRDEAIAAWQAVVARTPQGLQDHMTLADLLWELGHQEQAAAVYRTALTLSDHAYLDPAKQLTDEDRELVQQRIASAGSH